MKLSAKFVEKSRTQHRLLHFNAFKCEAPEDWLNLNAKCSIPFCSKFSLSKTRHGYF